MPQIIRGYKRNSTTYGVTSELHKGCWRPTTPAHGRPGGGVLATLDELGLTENIVVFSTAARLR